MTTHTHKSMCRISSCARSLALCCSDFKFKTKTKTVSLSEGRGKDGRHLLFVASLKSDCGEMIETVGGWRRDNTTFPTLHPVSRKCSLTRGEKPEGAEEKKLSHKDKGGILDNILINPLGQHLII